MLSEIAKSPKENTMTYTDDFTLPTEIVEQIAEQGFEYLPELICISVKVVSNEHEEIICELKLLDGQ